VPVLNYCKKGCSLLIVSIVLFFAISPGQNLTYLRRCKSRYRSASLTAESALVFPVFFFAIYMFWQCFILLLFQLSVCQEVSGAAIQYAHLGYPERVAEENVDISWLYLPILWSAVPDNDRVEGVFVSCKAAEDGSIEADITYRFVCEALCFPRIKLPVQQSIRFYPYLGEAAEDLFSVPVERDVVYMTEYGTVYHESRACTYLTVTVRNVAANAVALERNSSGRRYSECERCEKTEQTEFVYVSSGGTKYHWSLQCPALKRNVMEKTREEVAGVPGCHKCTKKQEVE